MPVRLGSTALPLLVVEELLDVDADVVPINIGLSVRLLIEDVPIRVGLSETLLITDDVPITVGVFITAVPIRVGLSVAVLVREVEHWQL